MAEETKKTAATAKTSDASSKTSDASSKTSATPPKATNPAPASASSQRLATAAKTAAARIQVEQNAEATAEDTDNLPPSGTGSETSDAEIYIDSNEPLENLADADPTGIADPNQFSSSSDPIADVYQPATDVTETQAGTEIRPVDPGMPNTVGQSDPVAASYGVHSGKVGHTVPIVDDYTPVNPRSGGIIGGAGGPGAVGRVKAEQEREKAAKQLMSALVDGTDATRRQADFEAQVAKEGKTKYRVVGGSIFTDAGKAVPGQPVYLTDAEAKRFSEMGRIAPWFD